MGAQMLMHATVTLGDPGGCGGWGGEWGDGAVRTP